MRKRLRADAIVSCRSGVKALLRPKRDLVGGCVVVVWVDVLSPELAFDGVEHLLSLLGVEWAVLQVVVDCACSLLTYAGRCGAGCWVHFVHVFLKSCVL